MIVQILTHTPIWVWLMLVALCALGWKQTRTRQLSLKRILTLPLVMLVLAISSLGNSSGAQVAVLTIWFLSMMGTALFIHSLHLPAGHAYDVQGRLFTVPGSLIPLFMILGIFVTKYVVAVMIAMQADMTQQSWFTPSCAALFGVMNGVFFGRTLRLIRLYQASRNTTGDIQLSA